MDGAPTDLDIGMNEVFFTQENLLEEQKIVSTRKMTNKNTKIIFLSLLLLLIFSLPYSSALALLPTEEQRTVFITAEKEVKRGNYSRLDEHRKNLKGYPLLPYLEYAYLTKRLSHISDKQIEQFIDLNSDTPLAGRLRYLWLKRLSRLNRRDDLIEHFRPTKDTALECSYRTALLKKGQTELALDNIKHIWMVGYSQPQECDPIFKAWKNTGDITNELLWQRIELAMQNRQLKLARFLARSLPENDRKQFRLWDKVYRQPQLVDSLKLFSPDNPLHSKILVQGIRRLAFRDIDHAIKSWPKLQDAFTFDLEDQAYIDQTLALLVGQNHHDDALSHLNAFNPQIENQRIREWRIRAALRNHDWPAVLATIGWLTDEEQATTRWQYWRARALEELGFIDEASGYYNRLAKERSFHAFLAADRLSLPYSFDNEPAEVTTQQLEAISLLPGFKRAKELLALDRPIEARREWEHTSKRLDEQQLLVAAKLAENWQWHSSAIFTAARISYWNDIPLRFPLGHKNSVIYQANKFDIEPAWVYGILRQESAFVTEARSSKGALGLMQLLPSTGRYIAKKNKTPYSGKYDLLIADKNIKLGSAYLQNVRKRLYDHPVLATAAYNAGYAKVKRWLPENDNMDADIWIETIPYDETRDYLERVLAYTAIYDWRLNPEHRNSLLRFMAPVGKPGTIATQSNQEKTADSSGSS